MSSPPERHPPAAGDSSGGEWREATDPKSGKRYYWHTRTRESTWTRPSSWPPSEEPSPSSQQVGMVQTQTSVGQTAVGPSALFANFNQNRKQPSTGPPSAEPVSKKQRGKSVAQKAHDEAHDYSVIQVSLNAFKNPELPVDVWNQFVDVLDEVAGVVSQLSFQSYLLAEYHIRRLLNEGEALPDINQSFHRSCLSLLSSSGRTIKDASLRTSYELYTGLRPPHMTTPSTAYLSHVLDSVAREMDTATKNHIKLNLESRLVRYVRLRYHNVESTKMAKQFMWMPFDPNYGPQHLVEDQRHFKDWIQLNPLDPDVVEKNLDHFVRKMLDVLNYYEALPPNTRGARAFTLLPKKGKLTLGFYMIEPTSLPGVLKKLDNSSQIAIIDAMVASMERRLPPTVPQEEVPRLRNLLAGRRMEQTKFRDTDQRDHSLTQLLWMTLFDVVKYETKNRKFATKVSTNAYAISIFLQKPRPENPPASDEYHNLIEARVKYANGGYDLIIGLDPGRSYPVSSFRGEVDLEVDPSWNFRDKSFCPQISTKEWRHDAKITEREQWELRMRRKYPEYDAAIAALPSLKVGSFGTFTANVALTLAQAPFLLQHHIRKRKYREYNFKISRFSKKALAKAARKLTKKRDPQPGEQRDCHSPSRTIIGWGDWSQQDGYLRGTPKAPVKKFRRAFKKMGFTVIEVDEFRTSKCCSLCGHVTEQPFSYGGPRPCHQVVRCSNSECGVIWQRDCNAARNMRDVLLSMLLGHPRPVALQRT